MPPRCRPESQDGSLASDVTWSNERRSAVGASGVAAPLEELDGVDYTGADEYVRMENVGPSPSNPGGWRVRDTGGHEVVFDRGTVVTVEPDLRLDDETVIVDPGGTPLLDDSGDGSNSSTPTGKSAAP